MLAVGCHAQVRCCLFFKTNVINKQIDQANTTIQSRLTSEDCQVAREWNVRDVEVGVVLVARCRELVHAGVEERQVVVARAGVDQERISRSDGDSVPVSVPSAFAKVERE
jgi:hypothetical protein